MSYYSKLPAAFLAAALLACLCAIPSLLHAQSITPASTVASAPPAPSGVYVGIFCNTMGKGASKDQKEQCTENLEQQIGRPFAAQLSYYGPRTFTQEAFLSDPMIIGDLKFHRIPLVSQSCQVSLSQYSPGGRAQEAVDNALTAMKAYPGPVIFTWFHEFDGCANGNTNTCQGNGDSPRCFAAFGDRAAKAAAFKAAWAFIYSERARLGATNVALGWRPTANTGLADFYPGDSQVDWILPDAYDRNGQGYAAVVSKIYNAYCTSSFTSKPCGLAEFGEPGCSGYSQAQFMREIETSTSAQFPNIHLLAWFDAQTNPRFDWKFDNCGGLNEFKHMVNLSQFKTMAY